MPRRAPDARLTRPRIADLPEVFGAADLAPCLGVSQNAVLRWIRIGQLPALRLGKSYRIRRDVVLELMAGRNGGQL